MFLIRVIIVMVIIMNIITLNFRGRQFFLLKSIVFNSINVHYFKSTVRLNSFHNGLFDFSFYIQKSVSRKET